MITRKQYMNNECTYREYYGQFVNSSVKNIVANHIGVERIKKSTDDSFNDIPLNQWDALNSSILNIAGRAIANANGTGGISLSDSVCTAKEAAKQIKEES